jgi:hypothetical protein
MSKALEILFDALFELDGTGKPLSEERMKEIEQQLRDAGIEAYVFSLRPQPIPENHYQCSQCHGVFERQRTDAAVLEEAKKTFSGFSEAELNIGLNIVCADCYDRLMAYAHSIGATSHAKH